MKPLKKSKKKYASALERKIAVSEPADPDSFPYLYIALREPSKEYKEEPRPKKPLYRVIKT